MITTRNGKELQYVVASGALGWDGGGWPWERPLVWARQIDPELFTITTKTLTRFPNKGRWWAVRPFYGGVWNNMGLPNKGIRWWLEKYKKLDLRKDFFFPEHPFEDRRMLPYKTLVSIAPDSSADLKFMLRRGMDYQLEEDPNFIGYELNVSCPNTEPKSYENIFNLVKCLGLGTSHIYASILKLNYQQAYYSEGLNEEQLLSFKPYIDAISINSAPRLSGKGAYSGRIAQEWNWVTGKYLQSLGFKVIFPSVWSYADMLKLTHDGADAISFGSVHMLRPCAPTRWLRRYKDESNYKKDL